MAALDSPAGEAAGSYYGFRLPLEMHALDEPKRGAVAAFGREICDRLASPSDAFRFDEVGTLRMRQITASWDDTCLGMSPRRAFDAIRDMFLTLGLDPPPPVFQAQQPADHPVRTEIELSRGGVRRILDALLKRIGIRPRRGPAHLSDAACRAELLAHHNHICAQFANLQAWFAAQCTQGHALPAIRRWYSRAAEE